MCIFYHTFCLPLAIGTFYKFPLNMDSMYVHCKFIFFSTLVPLLTCKYPCCRKVLEVHGENILTMIWSSHKKKVSWHKKKMECESWLGSQIFMKIHFNLFKNIYKNVFASPCQWWHFITETNHLTLVADADCLECIKWCSHVLSVLKCILVFLPFPEVGHPFLL